MELNFHEALAYLDGLISQKIEKENILKSTEFKFFCITPEEVERYLKSSNFDTKQTFISKQCLPGLDILGKLFHLSELEKQILLIVLAPEIDVKYERIYAYLQDDLTRKYPTISLISFLLCKDEAERLRILPYFLPHSPLFKFRLLRFVGNFTETSWLSCPLRLEESVRNFILGYYSLDNRLKTFAQLLFPVSKKRESSIKIKNLLNAINTGIEKRKKFFLYIYGPYGSGRKNFALDLAQAIGYNLLEVNTEYIIDSPAKLEELLSIIFREALLSGSLVYFNHFETLYTHEKFHFYESIFFKILKDFTWFVFCAGDKPWQPQYLPKDFLFLTTSFSYPDYPTSCKFWEDGLKDLILDQTKETAQILSGIFKFTQEEINQIVQLLKAYKITNGKINKKTIYEICHQRVSHKLNHLAQRLRLSYKLEDIVLPQDRLNQLKEIISFCRHRYQVFEKWGFKKKFPTQGIYVLFIGAPGTGKTMAAGIIAHELGLNLYRIDLSRIISKYIGETEKNLAKIFDAAEGSGVILFFDEADALFGKRTDVKDAHDRYANIEVSYLLQRIEEYNGIVILASNFHRNIDEAFVRRMHFIVEFPFPDEKMRQEIWKKIFPKETPLNEDIDFAFLAKEFKLSGANIRNAALAAAFYASEDNGKITIEHIMKGIKRELQKMGKTFQSSNFKL